MTALRSILIAGLSAGTMAAGLSALSSCGDQGAPASECFTAGFAGALSTPPTRNTTHLPVDLDVAGGGNGDVGSIQVVRDRGTVGVHGQEKIGRASCRERV